MHSNETRIFFAVLTGVIVIIILIAFFISSAIRYQKQKIKLRLAQLSLEISALEKERIRIASDLHDDLGSSLSAIKLQLRHLKSDDAKALKTVEDSRRYIDEAIQKLRHISFSMMPQVLQRNGLPDAIKELAETIEYTSGISVKCECNVDPVDKEKRVHIYRIVQEIMNNIIKHSQATIVEISLKKYKNLILLRLSDNGIGFDKKAVLQNGSGQGLQNIVSRVELLKAKIYSSPEPGKGVEYFIEIPDV
ncbi:MAG TPA: sensor histidine kinase [Parafilimonas sp.]|nr:sensor histidine kinase [Parafilimonas sp.]